MSEILWLGNLLPKHVKLKSIYKSSIVMLTHSGNNTLIILTQNLFKGALSVAQLAISATTDIELTQLAKLPHSYQL
jgi:hypothetical protein